MTQAQLDERWEQAISNYRRSLTRVVINRTYRAAAAVRLRRFAWSYLLAWPKGFTGSVAVFLGLNHGAAVDHPRPGLPAVGLFILSLFLRPSNPAWNDYWAARWIVAREPLSVEELHRRARHLWRVDVTESAIWIVRSYRLVDADFDAAVAQVEHSCELCQEPEGADKIGPVDGDRVLFCRHFDATPEYLRMIGGKLHFYFIGDGIIKRSDGAQLRARWLVLCGVCQRDALRRSPFSVGELCREFACQDSDWVGAPPTSAVK